MAILKNIESDLQIVFSLRKTSESPNWIGYDLKAMILEKNNEKEFLRLAFSDELSLENSIEPEIPSLCEAFDSLIQEKIDSYVFEPLDEKDFYLNIRKGVDFYRLTLFFDEVVLFDKYNWNIHPRIGLQMTISKHDLEQFSNELKSELEEILK